MTLPCEILRRTSESSLTIVRSCFYPKERFTLEREQKHDSVVKCAMDMIAYMYENVKNNFSIIRAGQNSDCRNQGALWCAVRCRSNPRCVTRDMAAYHNRGRVPTHLAPKGLAFIPRLKDGSFLLDHSVTLQDCSPPAVVRRKFVAAGFAACGCKARSNSRCAPPADSAGERHSN